jgi:hypothetical protein
MRFDVLIVMKMPVAVFLVVTPCTARRSGVGYCKECVMQ